MFWKGTKQGGHSESKQDRLKWQHVTHKNSMNGQSAGRGFRTKYQNNSVNKPCTRPAGRLWTSARARDTKGLSFAS